VFRRVSVLPPAVHGGLDGCLTSIHGTKSKFVS